MSDDSKTPTASDCCVPIAACSKDVCETTPFNQPPKKSSSQRALSNWQRLAYGVGHVFNDLAAGMWFSYLLIYLTEVENFDNVPAGNLILIGQVADAICTPFVGFESDRTRNGLCNLGKRKTWHLIGTICTLLSFPFIFEPCITCSHASSSLRILYYAPFILILQFGWASTQISHLSYSSELTPYEHERVILQSIRNFFTVFANIAVFGMFSLLFIIGSDTSGSSPSYGLDSSDEPKFRYMTFFYVGTGMLFNIIFYVGTRGISKNSDNDHSDKENIVKESKESSLEKSRSSRVTSFEGSIVKQSIMSWKDWLREHQFYQIGALYMCTRLFFNVSQVYFGIYLTKTIKLKKMYVAIMPLFLYGSSFLASILAPVLNKTAGRKRSYFVGAIVGISATIWLFFMGVGSNQIYGASMFLGIANSVLLITSLSMTSDLIGTNVESGAFVFGAMSFTDKLSNGIAIVLIEKFDPCSHLDCALASGYYRHIESMVPGGAILAALVVLLTLIPQTIGTRRKKQVPMNQPKTYSKCIDSCTSEDDFPHSNIQ